MQHYQEHILPGLADTSLLDIEKATGLSNPTCSRLKRGLQIPEPETLECARNTGRRDVKTRRSLPPLVSWTTHFIQVWVCPVL